MTPEITLRQLFAVAALTSALIAAITLSTKGVLASPTGPDTPVAPPSRHQMAQLDYVPGWWSRVVLYTPFGRYATYCDGEL